MAYECAGPVVRRARGRRPHDVRRRRTRPMAAHQQFTWHDRPYCTFGAGHLVRHPPDGQRPGRRPSSTPTSAAGTTATCSWSAPAACRRSAPPTRRSPWRRWPAVRAAGPGRGARSERADVDPVRVQALRDALQARADARARDDPGVPLRALLHRGRHQRRGGRDHPQRGDGGDAPHGARRPTCSTPSAASRRSTTRGFVPRYPTQLPYSDGTLVVGLRRFCAGDRGDVPGDRASRAGGRTSRWSRATPRSASSTPGSRLELRDLGEAVFTGSPRPADRTRPRSTTAAPATRSWSTTSTARWQRCELIVDQGEGLDHTIHERRPPAGRRPRPLLPVPADRRSATTTGRATSPTRHRPARGSPSTGTPSCRCATTRASPSCLRGARCGG